MAVARFLLCRKQWTIVLIVRVFSSSLPLNHHIPQVWLGTSGPISSPCMIYTLSWKLVTLQLTMRSLWPAERNHSKILFMRTISVSLKLKPLVLKKYLLSSKQKQQYIFFSFSPFYDIFLIHSLFYQEPWNQEKFEQLLIEWMIACDQPFDEVEKPEFIAAMSYGCTASKFNLPKWDGVRRWVMKLGDETVEQIKAMFAVRLPHLNIFPSWHFSGQVLEGKISLSLDAWTSSNCHAFLAIVAHYITNEGQCGTLLNIYQIIAHIFSEELLIDFCELVGQHSGENMAAAVWSTLETYNIQNKVCPCILIFDI